MKTVHSTDMVAHLWAHQSQAHARNATSSTSFDGAVFYSYRTPIATLHDTHRGRVALITSNKYSVTTSSKHMPAVRRALHGVADTLFSVPFVSATPADHVRNVAHLVEEYKELAGRLLRAHYLYGDNTESQESIGARLADAYRVVTDYCDVFKLKAPKIDVADDARVIAGKRAARAVRASDPKVVAARERARATTEARKERKEAEERRVRMLRDDERRAEFRLGTRVGHVTDAQGGAMLRVDGDTIRTSLGAEIPAEHAKRAWPIIQHARASRQSWNPGEGRTVYLGAFMLNEVGPDGTARVGCHTIYWAELERCARYLGLVP